MGDGRYADLTDEQLQGAEWAFRVVYSSPRVRGAALALVKDLIAEARTEMAHRPNPTDAQGGPVVDHFDDFTTLS